MRFVVALRPRDYPAPRWMVQVFRAGFLLAGSLAGVCVSIVLYAVASIVLGG